jgi:hypothetical protein
MAEMIYTNIEPKKEYSGFFRNQNTWKKTDGFKKLEADIRENGIKFPIVGFCNNGVLSETKCGNQRMAIALGLNINDIPAILFSIHHKTGFDGEQINELDDIIRICGEDIKNEPVWDEIRGAWRKLPYPKNQ